jgi:uncharacterized protein (TIGR02453 family)
MPPAAPPQFSSKTISFLRALKRHNDREWFRERKTEYETHVRRPMIALVERLAVDFKSFAPDLVADPKRSIYRIYRDTRFSEDKSPLKTHIAARFPSRELGPNEGAGLYLHVAPEEVWIGGGMYMPDTSTLQQVREHIAATLTEWRSIVDSPGFKRAVGRVHGERLKRVPRGFPPDHPAAEYLMLRQFLAGREYPSTIAWNGRLHAEILKVFRAVAPMVRFLNDPFLSGLSGYSAREQSSRPPLRDSRVHS